MKNIFAVVIVLFSILWVPGRAQADETVFERVARAKTINCGYFFWPPYMAKDANTGKFSGVNYEIMKAIGKNLGVKINWAAEIGVGQAVAELESNKIDMVCPSLWPSPARVFTLTLTNPTFYSAAYAYARADDKRFDGDLGKANHKDVKVSAIDGDYSHDLAVEKLPQATIVALPDSASIELLLQVKTRKADLVFCDEGTANEFNKANPNSLRKVQGLCPVRYYGETLAFKRGEYQLRDMVNLAILQLTNDGDIGKIVDVYKKKYNADWYAPAKALAK